MQARPIICGMIALAVLPTPGPSGPILPAPVCSLTTAADGAQGHGPADLAPHLPPVRQTTLDRLCLALRAALTQAVAPAPGTEIYLQLVATSPTGMTLRLLRRDGQAQETAGPPLTIDTIDGPSPSDHSLQQMARLLIAALPPA